MKTNRTQSQLMQSFEKIASEKGLIKQEPFKKVSEVASKISNIKPTENLLENIMKLCSGLRAQGFNKYADDVEEKLVQYKKAQALYDVCKETGEDLIDFAHPKGSHKMEGVEGDATIETILDKQKKIRDAVEKMPTGKLAAKDAINITRILLAQDYQKDLADINKSVVDAFNKINGALNTILKVASTALHFDPAAPKAHPWLSTLLDIIPGGQIPGAVLGFFAKYSDSIKTRQDQLKEDYADFNKEPSHEHLQDLLVRASDIKEVINQMPNDSPTIRQTAMDDIDLGISGLNDALSKWNSMGAAPTQTKAPKSLNVENPEETKIRNLINRVQASPKLNETGKTTLINWLNQQFKDLGDPQKAAATKQNIDNAEQQFTAKGYI